MGKGRGPAKGELHEESEEQSGQGTAPPAIVRPRGGHGSHPGAVPSAERAPVQEPKVPPRHELNLASALTAPLSMRKRMEAMAPPRRRPHLRETAVEPRLLRRMNAEAAIADRMARRRKVPKSSATPVHSI